MARSRAVSQAAVQRRRLPDEEAQDHRHRRARPSWPARASCRSPRTARPPTTPPRISCWRPARGRARLPGLEPDGKLIWTYREAMVPPVLPQIAAGGRLRRHRHRVRQLLSHPRRRRDGGRSAGPRAAGGGRGNLRLRRQGLHQAGHEAEDRHHGDRAEKGRGQCHLHPEGQGRQDRDTSPWTA